MIPGLGRSPGEGNSNPFQYSCLGNPIDQRAWRATQSTGSQELDNNNKGCLTRNLKSSCRNKTLLYFQWPKELPISAITLSSSEEGETATDQDIQEKVPGGCAAQAGPLRVRRVSRWRWENP